MESTMKKRILKEAIAIAAIISENYFNSIYDDGVYEGYIDAIDVIKDCAIICAKTLDVVDWSDLACIGNHRKYGLDDSINCFDDAVMWLAPRVIKDMSHLDSRIITGFEPKTDDQRRIY
jgi:hypothetical protein